MLICKTQSTTAKRGDTTGSGVNTVRLGLNVRWCAPSQRTGKRPSTARTKATLGVGVRLDDHLSAILLGRVYPADVIGEILGEQGVKRERQRTLPMLTMSYYCMALSLYLECAYEAVSEALSQGLQWA